MVRIRAFRAINDVESCRKFIEGHQRVLTSIGVTQVTSAKMDWAYNPAAFVIIVESLNDDRALGGARIHAVGGTQPLPIEEATGDMDPSIYDIVRTYGSRGSGELCGLWNSREVAGMGFGSTFLSRAAVVICTQINLTSLFALAAPYTVKMAENVGFHVINKVGNDGTFYYPKLDLLATALLNDDIVNIPTADTHERERIFDLRERPKQNFLEKTKNREIEIEYDLLFPHREELDFTYQL